MKPVADPKGGVVLLHGLGRTGRSMASIAAALKRKGYSTFAPSYGSPWLSMAGIIDQLRPRIDRFAAETDGPLHFVTHSLGGLVARALIASHPPQKLARVVMLAPPNRGSELADILFRLRLNRLVLGPVGPQLRTARPQIDQELLGRVDYDLGIIAGDRPLAPVFARLLLPYPNDGKVSVASTRLRDMRDHVVLPVTHTLMVYDRRVIAQVMAFLETGAFNR